MVVYIRIGIVEEDKDKHCCTGLIIVEKFDKIRMIYFLGVAEIVAVGIAELVAELDSGTGVGSTRGISSILFKTFQSILL